MSKDNKIRIKLKSFDARLLDQSVAKLVDTMRNTGATVSGPIMLPTEKDIYCVNRGTTIDKESMEHFETRTHKRLVDIYTNGSKTVDALFKLELPSGVDIEFKVPM